MLPESTNKLLIVLQKSINNLIISRSGMKQDAPS